MAVKTITIDMEAYEKLASMKQAGESFSQVIKKLTARSNRTAAALLADSAEFRFCADTLDAIETIVRERTNDFPHIPPLEG